MYFLVGEVSCASSIEVCRAEERQADEVVERIRHSLASVVLKKDS